MFTEHDLMSRDRDLALGAKEERAATDKLPYTQARAAASARCSLCMIVRDEERYLAGCLESVAELVHEIVVVDTGSTDSTLDIARRFGARVFHFPWVDDFSAARNECLRHATGEWIFWLDADERLDAPSRSKFQQLLKTLGNQNAAFGMAIIYLPAPGNLLATATKMIRMFRHHPQMHWKNRIHEEIVSALRASGARVVWTEIAIQNLGYQDLAERARKNERDLRLLLMDYAQNPDDRSVLFYLGRTYFCMQRPAQALPMLRRSLEHSRADDGSPLDLYLLIVECHRRLGQVKEGLAVCRAARARFPRDAGLRSLEGQLREASGDAAGAESCYLDLLGERTLGAFAGAPPGLVGFWTRHRLGSLYAKAGRMVDAEALWPTADNAYKAYLKQIGDRLDAEPGMLTPDLQQAYDSYLTLIKDAPATPGNDVEIVFQLPQTQQDILRTIQWAEKLDQSASRWACYGSLGTIGTAATAGGCFGTAGTLGTLGTWGGKGRSRRSIS
jgi:tetratricopeptide (TPR) repeat protein